jgi:hypothetical protein
MQIIKEVRKFVETNPANPSAQILARLVLALESETDFAITDIYKLDFDRFQMALKILEEWRIDRYFAGKAKLFDISLQIVEMQTPK